MDIQRVASGLFIFQLVLGQIPFAYGDDLLPIDNGFESRVEQACIEYQTLKNETPDISNPYWHCLCEFGTKRWQPTYSDGPKKGQKYTACQPAQKSLPAPPGQTEAGTGGGCVDANGRPIACPTTQHNPPPRVVIPPPEQPVHNPPPPPYRPQDEGPPPPARRDEAVRERVIVKEVKKEESGGGLPDWLLPGLIGAGLGVGIGYLIWGNKDNNQQYYNNPYYSPYMSGPYGQVPPRPFGPMGPYNPYNPYAGYSPFGQGGYRPVWGLAGGGGGGGFGMPPMMPPGGGMGGIGGGMTPGFGLGGGGGTMQPPVMLPLAR